MDFNDSVAQCLMSVPPKFEGRSVPPVHFYF